MSVTHPIPLWIVDPEVTAHRPAIGPDRPGQFVPSGARPIRCSSRACTDASLGSRPTGAAKNLCVVCADVGISAMPA